MDKMELYDHVQITGENPGGKLRYEDLANKNKLILIQAPYDFDMRLLTGMKVLLEGHQNLPTDESNMKMHSIIVPSFEIRKYCVAKQIRGSMIINQTIKIPPVHLPEKEELHLLQIPETSLHKWLPFGAGDPLKDRKRKLPKRKAEGINQSKDGRSFQIPPFTVGSCEEKKHHSKRKSKKTKDNNKLISQTEMD